MSEKDKEDVPEQNKPDPTAGGSTHAPMQGRKENQGDGAPEQTKGGDGKPLADG